MSGKKSNAIKELSWKPVRRGPYYCAPACGGRCTILQHDHAAILANQVAKHLGDDWKPFVHENLGWFAKVDHVSGCLKLSINESQGNVSYAAFIGDPDSPGGKWVEHGDTPEEAIENVCAVAHSDIVNEHKIATMQLALIEGKSLYRTRDTNRRKPYSLALLG